MPVKEPFRVVIEDTEAIPRKEWLLARKAAVCSSDYPAIVGLSHFKTSIDIFVDKSNLGDVEEEITLEQKYRFDTGHALEPVMHTAVAHLIGATAVRDKRMFESTVYPYMRCDIDGLFYIQEDTVIQGVRFKKGDVLLYEGKTTNPRNFVEWVRTPPAMYVAQCKHAMITRGLKYALLVISKGNDLKNDLVYHLIALEDSDTKTIPLVCKEFMEQYVRAGKPPSQVLGPYASEFKRSLMSYYGATAKDDSKVLRLPTSIHALLKESIAKRAELTQLNALVNAKENERDAIEAPLIEMLGSEYQSGVLESIYRTYTASYSVSRRQVLTADNMARLRFEKPEVYEQLVSEGYITESVTRTFAVRCKEKSATTKRNSRGGTR